MSTSAPTSRWSAVVFLTVGVEYTFTATPAAGGAIILQWSPDGVTWNTFSNCPFSSAVTGSVPSTALYLRGTSTGVAGTFDYSAANASRLPAPILQVQRTFSQPTAVFIGDSRQGQGYSSSSTNVSRYQEGALAQGNALSGNRLTVLNDSGVGGNTLADVYARLATDVFAYSPKYCFIKAGINSLQTQYAGLSAAANFAATKADALRLIQAITAAGIIPVIGTEGSYGTPVAAVRAATQAYNEWLRTASRIYNFYIWDYASVAIDPTSSTWASNNLSTFWRDGSSAANPCIHANNLGSYYEGKLVAALISALEPQPPKLVVGYEDYTNGTVGPPYANLCDNPTFQGSGGTNSTSGGITGTVPTSWTLAYGSGTPAGTCTTASWVDATTGLSRGNYWELTVGATSSGNEINLQSSNMVGTTPRAPVGSLVSASCAFQLISPVNVQQVAVWASADPGGGGQATWGVAGAVSYTSGGAVQPMVADTWYAETPEYLVPSAVLAERFYVRIKFNGNASGTVLRVWSPWYKAR